MVSIFKKKKKAVILVTCFYAIIVLLGLSMVSFLRVSNEGISSSRDSDSLRAFYAAESGISYAATEITRSSYQWYTHRDKNTPLTSQQTVTDTINSIQLDYPIPVTLPGAMIDSDSGCYTVSGKNFKVKSYPEIIDGFYSGTIVLISQGEYNNVKRTTEYRVGKESAYQYLMFMPQDYTIGSLTFNGRNAGGIHVNGNIYLTGNQYFNYLTTITSAGYMLRLQRYQYGDYHGNYNYPSSPTSPAQLSYHWYPSNTSRFYTGTTTFTTGDTNSPESATLNYYLSQTEYPGASWDYDKYSGSGADTSPAQYIVDDTDLKNLALYEMGNGPGSVSMLSSDSNQKINVKYTDHSPAEGALTEADAFYIASLAEKEGKPVDWTSFWQDWRNNHKNDYQQYHHDGTLTGGEDWQRRFFWSAYNWGDAYGGNGIPDGVNREWWQDLSYGDDRAEFVNDLTPAKVESTYTGEGLDLYYFNTEKQAPAWDAWLEDNGLDQIGLNKTLVQDKTQDGKYLDPTALLGKHADFDNVKKKALNGGIYIGRVETAAYAAWYNEYLNLFNQFIAALNDGSNIGLIMNLFSQLMFCYSQQPNEQYELLNPVPECTEEKYFFNPAQPVVIDGQYKKTNVLEIDVNAINARIASDKDTGGPLAEFNGVIYVDLNDYNWSQNSLNENADSVMLINGERLPEGGLSLATPNNIYLKGNYNLDPDGFLEKNRSADDPAVIARVISEKEHINESADLKWQPAELITKRMVYTLSDDFNEPSYMPMCYGRAQQYYDEYYGRLAGQDYVQGHPYYPSDSWAPDVAATRSIKPRVEQFFQDFYEGPVPSDWDASWISTNWPTNHVWPLGDINDDGKMDYLRANDLINDVQGHIESAYDSKYSFAAIHGSEGNNNPDTPSQLNFVTDKYIYNSAIITPYDFRGSSMEYWYDGKKIINGAFIQLPDNSSYKLPVTGSPTYGRSRTPSQNTYNYESRFGRGSKPSDRPSIGLTFGEEASWREIQNDFF
ncbi:MAG: hypothetical protein PHV17_03000 [Candidatus Omnitrophica bacterium]|nr:hypothetical protein [Candidatus Omnitrophota bacterium]